MSKMVIGNVSQLTPTKRKALFGVRLDLSKRLTTLATTAADQAQTQATARIKQAIPETPKPKPKAAELDPGSLTDELSPAEEEQLMEGIGLIMGALHNARGRSARAAREMVSGLYEAVAGFTDQVDGEEFASEGVDIIGLDGTGGLVRPTTKDEWR